MALLVAIKKVVTPHLLRGLPILFTNRPGNKCGVTAGRILAFFLSLCLPLSPALALSTYNDAEVKAAFLYQLPNFIEWSAAGEGAAQFCVIGKSPFKQVPKAGELRHITRLQTIKNCTLLFISASESARLGAVLAATRRYPVLTVSDIRTFAKSGGMVGFTEVNGSIKLEINTRALAQAGFRIDQHLLEVAHRVY